MFGNLWFVVSFLSPLVPSVIFVGSLTVVAWLAVANHSPFRVPTTLIALTTAVLCDAICLINSFLGGKLFPMAFHGGSLVPFFWMWQLVSFALIVVAGVLLRRERSILSRAIVWGTIGQTAMHCLEFLLFIGLRYT